MSAGALDQSITVEQLVREYLPADHKFGSTSVHDQRGNHNHEVKYLPAITLRGVSSSRRGEAVVCEIPEGSSMLIYSDYVGVRIEKTIAAIFFPSRMTQVKILAGGIIVIRRF